MADYKSQLDKAHEVMNPDNAPPWLQSLSKDEGQRLSEIATFLTNILEDTELFDIARWYEGPIDFGNHSTHGGAVMLSIAAGENASQILIESEQEEKVYTYELQPLEGRLKESPLGQNGNGIVLTSVLKGVVLKEIERDNLPGTDFRFLLEWFQEPFLSYLVDYTLDNNLTRGIHTAREAYLKSQKGADTGTGIPEPEPTEPGSNIRSS